MWATTWRGLINEPGRDWVRCSDLIDATLTWSGRRWTRNQVMEAIAHLPKPTVKRHGHWHYTSEHLAAVVAAAKAEAAR